MLGRCRRPRLWTITIVHMSRRLIVLSFGYARILGGRVAVAGHGRQYYRLGPDDFAPRDGLSEPWPLHPKELDPWYALVERRLGLSGSRRLPWLPDSELANYLNPTETETAFRDKISARWPGARPILGATRLR